jgi:DNA-directed RNA polymerase specialized sigma24 family protein
MTEFHQLIEQEIPQLRRYARTLTRSRERADEQDTLGRAYQRRILANRHQS